MLKILRSQSGNLAIVALLSVIGMMSGISMAGLAMRDTRSFQWDYESIQGIHFLRAEATRGQTVLENNPDAVSVIYTPLRTVGLQNTNLKRTFRLQSRINKEKSEQSGSALLEGTSGATGSVGESREYYKIRSLVEVRHGIGQAAYYGSSKSIVRKYSELTIVQSRFSEFMYFTDQDLSPADMNVYFYGQDVLTGKVHSNTDIHIKNAGGGNNGGWPTFLNLVTTAGRIVSTPGSYPRDQVFQGGLIEEYEGYEFPETASELRNGATHIGGSDIYMLTSDGSNATGFKADFSSPRRISKIVYDEYPPPGDSLWTNSFTVIDTTWSPFSVNGNRNRAYFVDGDLWIKGQFAGYQTWGCSGQMYLIGDIALSNTTIPQNPEDNSTDIIGLISENSIIIKYGYKHPTTMEREHPNHGADADGGGIWIYAALCALGDGQGNGFEDGVFTYEYMHPHPSTPAVLATVEYPDGTQKEVLFDWIDIHRRHYPPTASWPWPTPALGQQRLDLPWYNPLWPEARPYLERGTINVWGAIAQRRRGFVHRSHNDNEYPSNSGVWNVPLDMCGYPTDPQLITDPVFGAALGLIGQNYPGAEGNGTGYKKNYNYDNRLLSVSPLLYPAVRLKGGKEPMQQGNWNLKQPPRSLY
ncbi:MAG: hypothetical protein KBB33_02900 [Candidatus Cloacimonetes bacterium]|nr:hypothetical protein [Candidatus Cloacimonadota bacterium]HOA28777.1 hypothetical protein [Candidatus Cloacimonadota bacterium]HOH60074.1 hypothetical protein [Candidatus Cloacimonadota bacterium]